MKIPDFNLLKEAKQFLRANWEKGTKCPCCGQSVKLYKRKFNAGIAVFLIKLHKATKNGNFIHASEVLNGTKSLDYSIAVHWGLIEGDSEEVDGKRQSGMWRITEKGSQFVKNLRNIPSHIHIYNNTFVGFGEETIDIEQALGDKFDYEELMK